MLSRGAGFDYPGGVRRSIARVHDAAAFNRIRRFAASFSPKQPRPATQRHPEATNAVRMAR